MFEEQITESIEAGAPDITYSGNEGPKSPQQEQQMKIAQAQEEYRNYVMGQEEVGGEILPFEQWLRMTYEASRQGAAFGGIMGLDGRRQYGLGSKLKKFVRKIIPNEVADIAVKAAPFVAPFNPLAAGLMSGIGGFDQTGKIGSSLKSGLMNYGLGQGARYLGGAGFQTGINPMTGSGAQGAGFFSKPTGTETGLGKFFSKPKIDPTAGNSLGLGGSNPSGIAGNTSNISLAGDSGSAMEAFYKGGMDPTKVVAEQAKAFSIADLPGMVKKNLMAAGLGNNLMTGLLVGGLGAGALMGNMTEEEVMESNRGEGMDVEGIRTEVLTAMKDPSGEALKAIRIKYPFLGTQRSKDVSGLAMGGRAGYELGNLVSKSAGVFQPTSASMSAGDAPSFEGGSGMGGMIADLIRKNPQMFSGAQNNSPVNQNTGRGGMFSKFFSNPRMYDKDFIDENFNYIDDREEAAMGGRIGKAEGGIMDLGGMELDYRAEGGFVPIGAKEKADDVPARLSVNEFVFTADAVRNAGGGDIDQGAEIMERVMKNLEQGGQLSEESQGMQGARDMFQTSQRLGEVV